MQQTIKYTSTGEAVELLDTFEADSKTYDLVLRTVEEEDEDGEIVERKTPDIIVSKYLFAEYSEIPMFKRKTELETAIAERQAELTRLNGEIKAKNAENNALVVPKFSVGQELFVPVVYRKEVSKTTVCRIEISIDKDRVNYSYRGYDSSYVSGFATREEAEEELQRLVAEQQKSSEEYDRRNYDSALKTVKEYEAAHPDLIESGATSKEA